MLQKGIIEPSNSPWSSPTVLVRKKDGSIRFCIDYRKLNHVIVKDSYPLPRIDDSLDALGNAKWFSTLDLTSGYWQVEVRPNDVAKTAFCHHLWSLPILSTSFWSHECTSYFPKANGMCPCRITVAHLSSVLG